jgi:hypothetical protein
MANKKSKKYIRKKNRRNNISHKRKLITKKQKVAKNYKQTKKRNVLSGGGWRINWGNVGEDFLSLLGWVIFYGLLYLIASPVMLLMSIELAANAPQRPTTVSNKPWIDLNRYIIYTSSEHRAPRQTQLTSNERVLEEIADFQVSIDKNARKIVQVIKEKEIKESIREDKKSQWLEQTRLLMTYNSRKQYMLNQAKTTQKQKDQINQNISDTQNEKKILDDEIKKLDDEIKILDDEIIALVEINERNIKELQRKRTMRGGGDYEISLAKFEEILRLLKQSHSMLNEDICKKIIEMFVSSRFHKQKKQSITELFFDLIERSGDDTLKNKELITDFMLKVKDYLKSDLPVYSSSEIAKIEELTNTVRSDMSSSSLMTKMSQVFKLLRKSNHQPQIIRDNKTIKTLKEKKPIMQRLLQQIKKITLPKINLSKKFNITSRFRPTKAQLQAVEVIINVVEKKNNGANIEPLLNKAAEAVAAAEKDANEDAEHDAEENTDAVAEHDAEENADAVAEHDSDAGHDAEAVAYPYEDLPEK